LKVFQILKKAAPKKFIQRKVLLVAPTNADSLVMVPPGLRGIPVGLGISYPKGNCPAECYFYLDGLQKPQRIYGNDQWQALFLALNLMRKTLLLRLRGGWTIEWFEDGCELIGSEPGEALSMEEIFET
jgi:hypothetical protein